MAVVASGLGPAQGLASESWDPSISVGILAHAQDASGEVLSTFPARTAFDPSVRDDPLILVPAIPVGLQLTAPEITLGGRVFRPFVHGRIQVPMDPDRTIARRGTLPSPVRLPVDPSNTLAADAIAGQGTLVTATLDMTGQVGLGVSTDLAIEALPIRIGVSLDYVAERVSIDGEVVYVRGAGANDTKPFTIHRLHEVERSLFHFLGPRVELDTLVGERGPFRITLFADLGAFFALGNRSSSFTARDLGDSAAVDFEIKPWLVQAGAGIRLTWAGER